MSGPPSLTGTLPLDTDDGTLVSWEAEHDSLQNCTARTCAEARSRRMALEVMHDLFYHKDLPLKCKEEELDRVITKAKEDIQQLNYNIQYGDCTDPHHAEHSLSRVRQQRREWKAQRKVAQGVRGRAGREITAVKQERAPILRLLKDTVRLLGEAKVVERRCSGTSCTLTVPTPLWVTPGTGIEPIPETETSLDEGYPWQQQPYLEVGGHGGGPPIQALYAHARVTKLEGWAGSAYGGWDPTIVGLRAHFSNSETRMWGRTSGDVLIIDLKGRIITEANLYNNDGGNRLGGIEMVTVNEKGEQRQEHSMIAPGNRGQQSSIAVGSGILVGLWVRYGMDIDALALMFLKPVK